MERISYEKTLRVIEEKRINELLGFLKTLPLFSCWTNVALLKVKYHFSKNTYIRNSIIYREGEPSSKVYIVAKGEFKESCKIPLNGQITDDNLSPLCFEEKKKLNLIRMSLSSTRRNLLKYTSVMQM